MVTLSDGECVWLDAESELEYPVKFVSNRREVKLKGRGYFEVKKGADRPFFVNAGEFRLRVYGTEFNMDVYPGDSVRVVLVNGSVGFYANATTSEYHLKPGQLGRRTCSPGKWKFVMWIPILTLPGKTRKSCSWIRRWKLYWMNCPVGMT